MTKVSSADGTVLGSFPVGDGPNGIAFDGTNIWVANFFSDDVTKLTNKGIVLGTFPVGDGPAGVLYDGTNIWVANSGGDNATMMSIKGQIRGVKGGEASGDIADGVVTTAKLAAGSVSTSKIANAAVTNSKLGPDSVSSSRISDNSVNPQDVSFFYTQSSSKGGEASDITDGVVTTAKLANNSVTNTKLAPDSVSSSRILDGSVNPQDVSFNYAQSSAKGGKANDADTLDGLDSSAFALASAGGGGGASDALIATLLQPYLISAVDTGGFVGEHISMAIGVDGLPIIAYYDATNSALKAAHCEDLACTRATTSTLDSAGDVGR